MPTGPIETMVLKEVTIEDVAYVIRVGGIRLIEMTPLDKPCVRIRYTISGIPGSRTTTIKDMEHMHEAATVLSGKETTRAILLYLPSGQLAGFYTTNPATAVLFDQMEA